MMTKLFKILILLIYGTFFSQSITSDYLATYDIKYPFYGKPNNEQFILFINTKENVSLYKSTNQYVLDSLIKTKKVGQNDVNAQLKYNTAIPEIVVRRKSKFQVYEQVIDTKIRYEEPEDIKWTILNERKTYAGYKTRKAYTTKYGRKWIAWFAEDLPLNFGPYKFSGLPGLIIRMYDEKGEYYFTLSQFKKKRREIILPQDKNYKAFTKKAFKNAKYNIQTDLSNSAIIFNDSKERKEWLDGIIKRIKNSPNLDIE
ncbi:GLPGLI family protein [Chryseobacterium sp. PBS4-4]|uniref:GLPGLI family protein n=1 Tax=Chryseobacterium edaphi TaxID=2976532 RepID=A0ABT2W6A3_9FLAO|nr:GLPGLI family protein [Chryseobacterium edaphi]MCU7617498.1 GLPGLI family protein [Chryseobacterium edaphi]